jgi:hypothetical protein
MRCTFPLARQAGSVGHGGEGEGDGVGEAVAAAAVLPVAAVLPRSEGCVGGVCGATINLITRATGPHLSLYRWRQGAPTIEGWAHVKGARWAVGPTREEIILTFSP